ncbi:MAG: zinc ribbon domain-containing protein [Xanthomonadales bacterium]|nr:zinc ribbon domain-containing protein [Xanthomonadales bacterium]
MAIIACPECGKKISSRAAICSYCGYQLGEATEQDLEVFRARRLRERIYRLNMISYAVITLFLGGFGWYWWATGGFVAPSPLGPFAVMALAAIAYLVVRVLLFRSRRQRKAMRQRININRDLRQNL